MILYILCSLLSDERDYVSDTIGIHSQSSPPRLEDTPHSYKWVPHQSHFHPKIHNVLHSDHARARDPVTIIQEKVYNYRHFKSAEQRRHQTGNILNGVGQSYPVVLGSSSQQSTSLSFSLFVCSKVVYTGRSLNESRIVSCLS